MVCSCSNGFDVIVEWFRCKHLAELRVVGQFSTLIQHDVAFGFWEVSWDVLVKPAFHPGCRSSFGDSSRCHFKSCVMVDYVNVDCFPSEFDKVLISTLVFRTLSGECKIHRQPLAVVSGMACGGCASIAAVGLRLHTDRAVIHD